MLDLSADQIEKNYHVFVSLCKNLEDRTDGFLAMIDHFGDRLVLAPASTKLEYHCAFAGGLIDHSLRVFANARKLASAYHANLPIQSLIVGCLFHDFGKVGDLDNDYYLEQDSDWHREKLGQMYKINKQIQSMPNAERGLWVMQHFGIKLTMDEWIAIRCNDGPSVDENKPYAMREPLLAVIVHQADRMACFQEKEIYGG